MYPAYDDVVTSGVLHHGVAVPDVPPIENRTEVLLLLGGVAEVAEREVDQLHFLLVDAVVLLDNGDLAKGQRTSRSCHISSNNCAGLWM
jgi:hypothetical protein